MLKMETDRERVVVKNSNEIKDEIKVSSSEMDLNKGDNVKIYVEFISEKADCKLVLNKFKEEKDLEIRKWIAEKILSGEIELNYFVADSDSYECPPSRIKNRIIEL
jgi:hypothetical protein